jgi:hypothetical protein
MLTKPRACIYSRTAVSLVQLVLKLLHLQEPRNDDVSVIGYKYEILSKCLIIRTSEEIYDVPPARPKASPHGSNYHQVCCRTMTRRLRLFTIRPTT